MPRIISNIHENNSRHSGYHTNLLSNSHQVLERIATNTESSGSNGSATAANQTTTHTKLQSIDDRIHSFSGHTNNTTAMGDGSDQLRTVNLGYDRTNGKVRSILVDSAGKQVVDNPTFDSLIGATNNTITGIGEGSDQLRVLPLGYDRSNGKAVSFLVDDAGHLQIDVISAPTTNITGTVTANLSATDNAVLDAIATDGDNIQSLLTALDTVQDNALLKLSSLVSSTEKTVQSYTLSNGGSIAGSGGNLTSSSIELKQYKSLTTVITTNGSLFDFMFSFEGSFDNSSFFTIPMSITSSNNYDDGSFKKFIIIKDFDVKFIKLKITNNGASTSVFSADLCY